MQKEELLHLHMLMVHVKRYFEETCGEEIGAKRYMSLDVSPVHIHKNKKFHKEAILILGEEVVSYIRSRNMPHLDYTNEVLQKKVAVEH